MLQTAGETEYQRAPWQTHEAATFVRFYAHEVYDRAASQREGRPIIHVKDYIEFPRAGEIDVLRRQATEFDKMRFPEQWKAYQDAREDAPSGTPVATLFPAHPEIISTLRYFKCHTVEQLAQMSDHGVQKIGLGAHEWRDKARELLKAAEGSQGYHELSRQLAERDATITKLTDQLASLEARLSDQPQQNIEEVVEKAVAKHMQPKRGRPAKNREQSEEEAA